MKKITFLLTFLGIVLGGYAQTTVTIGSETNVSGTNTNGNPIYRSSASSGFNFSQSVQLLTATDMANASIPSGAVITKIAFYKDNTFTLSAGRTATLNIFMKNSTNTTLNTTSSFSTWTTGSANVYSNATLQPSDIPAAAGWVEFTLSTPFVYTGGSVETALNWAINAGTGNPTTGAFVWQYSNATATQAVGTSASAAITGNLVTGQTRVYNTQITYTATPCSGTPAPGNTLSSNAPVCIGAYNTTLSLQNLTLGTGVTYQWYMNGNPVAGATNNTLGVSVSAADTYYCAVTCSGNTTNSNPITLSAPLTNGISAFPWTENFDSLTVLSGTSFPSCWAKENGDWSTSNATTYNTARSGANYLRDAYSATDEYIWTPAMYLTAGTSYDFSNWVQGDGGTGWLVDYFVNSTPNSAGATQIGTTYNVPGSGTIAIQTYNQVTRTFVPTVTGNYYFAVRVNQPSSTPWYVAFDDFKVDLTPACVAPTGLVASNITTSSADFSWGAVAGSAGYEYVVSTSNVAPTGAGTSTTATTATITGLASNTVYYGFVRNNCGATFSSWSGPFAFTTLCNATNVPYTQDFESATVPAMPACTMAINPGTGNIWDTNLSPGSGFTTKVLRYRYNSTNAADTWFFTQGVNLTAGTSYRISYDYGNNSTSYVEKLKVAYGTNTDAASMINVIADHPSVNQNALQNNIVDFVPATTGVYYFGFQAYSDANMFNLYVDNISVVVTPACSQPLGLAAANITSTSADLSWGAVAGAAGYEYVIDNVATDPTGAGTATTATTFNATGLTPNTVYYLHVRTSCGAIFSNWSTLMVTIPATPPANDSCSAPIALTVGGIYTDQDIDTTSLGGTLSAETPSPTCGTTGFATTGKDVWYSVVVPASGTLTIETNVDSVGGAGLLLDVVTSVYSGTCAGLTELGCDDSSGNITSPAGADYSKLSLTGQTPGDTLLIRAFGWNGTQGTFSISAYDASLSSNSFDFTGFKAFPNPVKDMFNLSYTKEISAISVVNLLGQEVLSKKANAFNTTLDMSSLAKGTYLVKVTSEDQVGTIKVVKE